MLSPEQLALLRAYGEERSAAPGDVLFRIGDTRYPLMVSLVNWFVVRLPLAYVFAFVFGLGLTGIWLGVTIDYFVRAALLAARFRSGAWARVRV